MNRCSENLALFVRCEIKTVSRCELKRCRCREPVFFDGQRLPASYANFYIANKIVLVPTFNDANDRIALNKLAELFPDAPGCWNRAPRI